MATPYYPPVASAPVPVEWHNAPCVHSGLEWDCLSCLEGALWRCDRAYQEVKAQVTAVETVAIRYRGNGRSWQRRWAAPLMDTLCALIVKAQPDSPLPAPSAPSAATDAGRAANPKGPSCPPAFPSDSE